MYKIKETGRVYREAKLKKNWDKKLQLLKSKILEKIRTRQYDEEGKNILDLLKHLQVSLNLLFMCILSATCQLHDGMLRFCYAQSIICMRKSSSQEHASCSYCDKDTLFLSLAYIMMILHA